MSRNVSDWFLTRVHDICTPITETFFSFFGQRPTVVATVQRLPRCPHPAPKRSSPGSHIIHQILRVNHLIAYHRDVQTSATGCHTYSSSCRRPTSTISDERQNLSQHSWEHPCARFCCTCNIQAVSSGGFDYLESASLITQSSRVLAGSLQWSTI